MPFQRPLFSARVLQRELERLRRTRKPPAGGFETIREWARRIDGGFLNRYTETQIEQAFVSAIFVGVLGYRHLGFETAHILPKPTGSPGRGIPDAVLGTFNAGAGVERWRAVCEIKGLSVDLDAPQTSRHNRETPVQQAFRYALTGRPGIEWVIVTNFREIRLYRNGYMGAHQRWTLTELRDQDRFFEFWALLCQPHLAPETGDPSETLRILNASVNAGLTLTEGFYGLYDLARQKIARFLSQDRALASVDSSVVLGKAHKLLNRVLFAAFCEDHPAQLLPRATLQQLHEEAARERRSGSYWNVFRRFFAELDRGSPPGSPSGYNAFNGGLFAPDDLLDSVRLPDSLFTSPLVFKKTRQESREIRGVFGFYVYDFSAELDVDALGAIFEQSLKDLPHAVASVRGHGAISVTRRENKGVYYTSPAMTAYLVERTLDEYLAPMAQAIARDVAAMPVQARKGRRSLSAEDTRDVFYFRMYMDRLRGLNVIDPACGSGAFLIAAFERLHEEYEHTNAALAQLRGAESMFALNRTILRDNLFGVDVLSESVEISKLSLWLRTAAKDEALEKLDRNLVCTDTLRYTPKQRFDIAVGNPPWGADLDGWTDEEILEQFPMVGSEKDSAAMFVIRTLDLLKPGGVLGFVLPNSWLTVSGYEPFRRWLLESCEVVEITHLWKIFEDVNHDACLLVLRRFSSDRSESTRNTRVRALSRGVSEREKHQRLAERRFAWEFEVDARVWATEPAARFETVYPPDVARELSRVASRCRELGNLFDVTVGIQVYHQRNVPKEMIEARAFHAEMRKGADWFPYITGNEVQRYFEVPRSNAYLYYNERLCDKRELEHYAEPRILVQQIFWNRLSASLTRPEGPVLYLNTLFSISSPRTVLTLPAVLAILNSRFMSGAYERFANRIFGDKFPKVSKLDLARLPIPPVTPKQIRELEGLGAVLQERWQQLKKHALEFFDFIRLADGRRPAAGAFAQFWELDRDDVPQLIVESFPELDLGSREVIMQRWVAANTIVGASWGTIAAAEDRVEELVRGLYGIKASVYDRLVARVPAPSVADVLLPRS